MFSETDSLVIEGTDKYYLCFAYLGLKNRFEEYPKLRELMRLKDELIQVRATPPMYLQCDLRHFDLQNLNSQFDVILVEPPVDRSWSWTEVSQCIFLRNAVPCQLSGQPETSANLYVALYLWSVRVYWQIV